MFRDEAESGGAEKRKQLQKLIRACERGEFGAVIPSLDRLSRNVRIAENLFHKFETLGIHVLIADMPNYTPIDRREVLIRQIREAIAEDARKEIIERLLKGRQERVRKGRSAGGNVLYGYRRQGKALVENPGEADAVRLIFDLARKNVANPEIVKKLNSCGAVQRNGQAWTRRQVRAILSRRERYEQGLTRYGHVVGTNPELILIPKREAGI